MKKLTIQNIKSLNPCNDRYQNFEKHYPKFSGDMAKFLRLKKITHSDKIWVFFRSIPVKTIPLVAADFAESVLINFEKVYPNNDCPRKAIDAARSAAESAGAAARSAAESAESAARSARSAAAESAESAAESAESAGAAARSAQRDKLIEMVQAEGKERVKKGESK